MASSHAIKRFFGAFRWVRIWQFRQLLPQLLLWRLKLVNPRVVVLGLDTMIMATALLNRLLHRCDVINIRAARIAFAGSNDSRPEL
jgi:hypothetical protein